MENSIHVINASYGSGSVQAVDVTATVQAFVNANRGGSLVVSNDSLRLSSDPSVGQRKSLVVTCQYTNGVESSLEIIKSAVEGGTISFAPPEKFVPVNLVSATYGTDKVFKDITYGLACFMADPNNNYVISTDPLCSLYCYGQDIAPGIAKTLNLIITKQGSPEHRICLNDGQEVNLIEVLPQV